MRKVAPTCLHMKSGRTSLPRFFITSPSTMYPGTDGTFGAFPFLISSACAARTSGPCAMNCHTIVSSLLVAWWRSPEFMGSRRASRKARSMFDASTLAPDAAPLGALSTPASIFCAPPGKRNMSAAWSPRPPSFRKGEPPSLVTMKTGTFESFALNALVRRF